LRKVYGKLELPLSYLFPPAVSPDRTSEDMTEHHPTYFLAAVVAVMAAVVLRLAGMPGPWPAAIALYVYGAVAWPVLRDRMPSLEPAMYAAVWVSAAMLMIAYETLAVYAGP
jgi:hypothetical protein